MPHFLRKQRRIAQSQVPFPVVLGPGLFLFLEVVAVRHISVLQKRVATRSVKKGFGDPQQASASEEKWTEMPCLQTCETEKNVKTWQNF